MDEAQFLTREEVMYLVHLVDVCGIPVMCYGLRADFRGELFPGSYELLVMADKLEEVKTICWCGKKAAFNARFDANGKVLKEGEHVVLGANDQYIGLCRRHWMLCNIWPRRGGAERTETRGGGVCAMPAGIVAAKAMLHQWEEPVLSGTNGAGCVFFCGCNLGCVFCQNGKISHENFGKVLSPARLREIFFELIAQGAHCIDLVSPTHFTPWVCEALADPLPVPVVWNSGGYERVETLKTLEGRVQIYLPDLKYALEKPARELSCAGDYFPVAAAAIDEMLRQVGPYQIGDDGLMKSGVIIRHLVLPGQLENTKAIIDYVSAHFPPHTVLFSLMSQYTPQPGASGALARRLNHAEYRAAVRYMTDCGITDGFCQELSSAKEEYTPIFDLQGV